MLVCGAAVADDSAATAKSAVSVVPAHSTSTHSSAQEIATHIKEYMSKAEAGDPDAQFILGMAYTQGLGVPADAAKAGEWMQKAAEGYRKPIYAKNGDALYKLGSIYALGIGTPKDMKQATFWWEKAAEQGSVHGQIVTATIYSGGAKRDYVTADKWWRAAEMSGDSNAGKMRKALEKIMTPADIAKAQAQAEAWKAAHPH